jgi:murein DD-endopeptidase MepM/ murein hydrolase activator NlpD
MKKIFPVAVCLIAVIALVAVLQDQSRTENNTVVQETPAATSATSTEATSSPVADTPQETQASMSAYPSIIEQGEPALITFQNLPAATTVDKLTFNDKILGVFIYNNKPSAFVGIDLKMTPGTYLLTGTLSDGRIIKKNVVVGKRYIAEAPLGIPASLGGNTPAGESNLLTSLAKDNATLASIPTVNEMLWSGKFGYPVENPIVTDTYGYTRLTGASTISHKGTDFHAPTGTPVMAMNSGVVRISQFFTAYGNTIVIDHGFGLQTLYMHLSEADVKVGDTVGKGQVIGKSGTTGYAEGPHLHVSVKINSISIDPEKFLALF